MKAHRRSTHLGFACAFGRREVLALLGGSAAAIAMPAQARGAANRAREIARIERPRVLAAAERFVSEAPVTVTSSRAARSPGGPHDYYSEGDYWWPDPGDPSGPYIRRDGYSNPNKFDDHRLALIRFGIIVPALAAAWTLTGDRRYAEGAARHLKAWFVDPATRMNPNLQHAQAIIGVNTGRGIGIIDTVHLIEAARAAERLGAAEVPGYGAAQKAAVRGWFADYLAWLVTSENGRDERDEANNHASAWALQAAAFARLTGNDEMLRELRQDFRNVLVPRQIAPDGRQPLELARTKPYGYSLFNLDILGTLATLLSTRRENLWRWRTTDGRGLAPALAFMAPFIADKTRWPYPPDVQHFDSLPFRHIALLLGSEALAQPHLFALWQRLEPDPANAEAIRNMPIRQPLLWTAGR